MPTIANDQLTVEVAPLGAELQAVTDKAGRNWLWQGDPAFWAGRSPLLFPVVGKHRDCMVLIEGRHYPIKPHGVARTSSFALVEQAAESAGLEQHQRDDLFLAKLSREGAEERALGEEAWRTAQLYEVIKSNAAYRLAQEDRVRDEMRRQAALAQASHYASALVEA